MIRIFLYFVGYRIVFPQPVAFKRANCEMKQLHCDISKMLIQLRTYRADLLFFI